MNTLNIVQIALTSWGQTYIVDIHQHLWKPKRRSRFPSLLMEVGLSGRTSSKHLKHWWPFCSERAKMHIENSRSVANPNDTCLSFARPTQLLLNLAAGFWDKRALVNVNKKEVTCNLSLAWLHPEEQGNQSYVNHSMQQRKICPHAWVPSHWKLNHQSSR